MLFAEDLENLFPILFLNFHKVVLSAGTFHVKLDLAFGGLALDTGTNLLKTNDALEAELLVIDLGQLDRGLWSY